MKVIKGVQFGKKGVFLVGVVFLAVAMAVGTYSSTLSLQVASRNMRNKELVMHAHMGAETAIELGIRMLNASDSLSPSQAIYPGGTQNNCLNPVSPVVNSQPLTFGQITLSNSSGVFQEHYKVNFAVNMDLSASDLLSQSVWLQTADLYADMGKNEGYPETGIIAPNEYSGSQTGMNYAPVCYNGSYLRLLRAEANVVRVGGETSPNPFRRRIAAIVSIDPDCDDLTPTFTGYGGCKAEVIHWYEE